MGIPESVACRAEGRRAQGVLDLEPSSESCIHLLEILTFGFVGFPFFYVIHLFSV